MQSYNIAYREEKSVRPSPQLTLTIGRTVGILLLLQLIFALTLPFILSKPITLSSPAFLTAVSEHSSQIRLAVLLSFVGSALTVSLGITMLQMLWIYSKHLSLLFLVVCIVSCILDVMHASAIMSMLSISNSFFNSGIANSELYQIVGAVVSSSRRSAHITQLFAIGAWMFVFYISLFRFKLIPRALAVIGVIGIVSQFIGVTLMMFLGYRQIGQMAMPLLPIQITIGVWLIIKGFKDRAEKSACVS